MRLLRVTMGLLAFCSCTVSALAVNEAAIADRKREALDEALKKVTLQINQDQTLNQYEKQSHNTVASFEQQIAGLQKNTDNLVIQRKALIGQLAYINRNKVDPTNTEQLADFLEQEQVQLEDFLLAAYIKKQPRTPLIMAVLTQPLSERIKARQRDTILLTARANLFAISKKADTLQPELETVNLEIEESEVALARAESEFKELKKVTTMNAERRRLIQKEVLAVQAKIAEMQSELERTEARDLREAERKLVELGLIEKRVGTHAQARLPKGDTLTWPIESRRVTAGFNGQSYLAYFGVPHKAIDIATNQGTAVAAAADGTVFFVKDGGQYGYSYILIAHKGLVATLYGHMNVAYVTAGQKIFKGQVIGLSGGAPGTRGAGPMTTGAHLHFEVIKNGIHIDPFSVL